MSANPQVATPAATPEPAPAPVQGTPAPAAVPAAQPEEPQVKTFYSKKVAEAPKEPPFDASKLPPDLQGVYKSMNGDYTRKTQELADMRRSIESEQGVLKAEREAMQRNHDTLMEALRGRTAEAQPSSPQDPMAQIQALRNEGRYEEADKLFLDLAKQTAEAQVAPLRQEAQTQKNFALFNNVSNTTKESFPVVKEHWDYVKQTWESNTPTMQAVRRLATASPEMIQFFTPLAMVSIANEAQLKKLEPAYQSLHEENVKLKERLGVTKARAVPSSLVSTSGASRETRGEGGGLDGAIKRAMDKLQGA